MHSFLFNHDQHTPKYSPTTYLLPLLAIEVLLFNKPLLIMERHVVSSTVFISISNPPNIRNYPIVLRTREENYIK